VAQGFYLNYNDFLKEEAKATKCSEGTRNTERKIEELLGEDQFGFRRGTGTKDAIGIKVSPVTGHEGHRGVKVALLLL